MFVSIILAAGEGTRMKSKYSKVGQKILNKPMIEYILKASEDAGVEKNIIIVGTNKDYIEDLFGDRAIYKEQKIGEEYPYGTGYAVGLATDEIKDDDEVLILTGDSPLLRGETLKDFIDFHKSHNNDGSLLSAMIDDPFGYGRIIRDDKGFLEAIVEEKDTNDEQKKIKECNSGIFIFNGGLLKESLKTLDMNNAQGEIYVTDVIKKLSDQNKRLGVFKLEDVTEAYGINTKKQLAEAQEIMRARVNEKLMLDGVVMENPSNIFIEPGVKIGRDTYIYSGSKITGNTVIGEDCIIENSTISNSIIGNNVHIKTSDIEDSNIESNIKIGPFAHLRPGSHIKDGVKIGNFVEIKNSTMEEGSKAGHHAYVGDGEVGKNVNIGCGVIFANYDGKNKHKTKIGDNSFIGSNSTLIAPVEIEEDGFVGADSTVTEDVRKGALYITRAKVRQIENWVYKKRGDDNE